MGIARIIKKKPRINNDDMVMKIVKNSFVTGDASLKSRASKIGVYAICYKVIIKVFLNLQANLTK
jgi:hypothetical protein